MYYAIINKIGTKTQLKFKGEETKFQGCFIRNNFKEMIYLLRQFARVKKGDHGYYTVDLYNEKEYPTKKYRQIIIDNSTIILYESELGEIKAHIIRN